MFAGDFDSGRILAQQRAKWILINIQDPTEFQCQVLNRDIWSNAAVKDAIKEHFLFMQFGSGSQEGQKYVNLYKAYRYPHVAIIDPRTGEKVAELKRLSEPVDFIEELYDFTDRNSLTDFKNKKAKTEPKVKKSVSEMSEEEQLLAAMQASLDANGGTTSGRHSVQPIDVDADEETAPEAPGHVSIFDSIQSVEHPDRPDGKDATRLQIRLPDGSRIVMRVLKSDPVRFLFEHVKATVPAVDGKQFELLSPSRQMLTEYLDSTIAEAKVEGAAIMLTFA
ncbi:hypothetical protein HDU93_001700 [Gonapodya sp. JEL0774]|nr:hypothetical protein HDU93_001700 [Gonapodya sp. JEL0774]